MSNTTKYILIAGMLVSGSMNTLSKKAQNDSSAKGLYGDTHDFSHPWFQSLLMFIGEMLCIFAHIYSKRRALSKDNYRSALVNAAESDVDDIPSKHDGSRRWFKDALLFLGPTCCDIFGTTLGGIGLLYVQASIWQMLRGSIVIFSGVLSKIFLKRVLLPYRWFGMCVVAVGLGLVGSASLLSESSGNENLLIVGILLILAGQLCSSVQMVVEESYLKSRKFPPLLVVGSEGMWGVMLMLFVVLPIVYAIPGDQYGHYENSLDAVAQMGNSTELMLFGMMYLVSISLYNFTGLSVTKRLTAVHRTLIDALRTILVWTIELLIYYCISDGSYGEAWNKYSFMELGGFVLLLVGTLIYNQVIRLPGFRYEDEAYVPVDESIKQSLLHEMDTAEKGYGEKEWPKAVLHES